MQENIETKNIGNRKFIIELRFDPKVSMLDKKGLLAEQIGNCKAFNINHWEIGQGEVSIRDNEDKEKATNIVVVTYNRLSFISFKINSIEGFYSTFKKIYEEVILVLGELNIRRIGCRIIGTYMVKSKDYNSVLNNFKSSFPAKFLLEQYPAKDFLFNLVYENGMYQIGPLNEEDGFYDREFKISDCKKHVGVVIDTDNYLTNETQNINSKSLIKDVYTLSLSVEKDLYSNLAEF
ncbi:hypothetical protein [Xylanibacter rarus]|jgi:hypothetical protein|uniref:hypothetical protein n=1 Tax=Xylanibacter rarus TaxID=1676614 RepID=UPI003AB95C69